MSATVIARNKEAALNILQFMQTLPKKLKKDVLSQTNINGENSVQLIRDDAWGDDLYSIILHNFGFDLFELTKLSAGPLARIITQFKAT